MNRCIAILILLFALAMPCPAAEKVVIQDATTNALNIVFIGDGWAAGDRVGFLTFVSNRVNQINTQQWVSGVSGGIYSNRIRITAVLTNSTTSGITATTANAGLTPLQSYVTSVSLRQNITDLSSVMNDVSLSGSTNIPITVLNIGDYKATSLSGRLCMSTNLEFEILAHELGHVIPSMAGRTILGDEYDGSGDVGATNVAATLTGATNNWIVEFPSLGAFTGTLTPFGGGTAYYPDTRGCKMRAVASPFCLVCSNQMSLSFMEIAGISNIVATATATSGFGTAKFQTLRIGP